MIFALTNLLFFGRVSKTLYMLYPLFFWLGCGYLNRKKYNTISFRKENLFLSLLSYLIGFITTFIYVTMLDNPIVAKYFYIIWNFPMVIYLKKIIIMESPFSEIYKYYIYSFVANTLYLIMYFVGYYFINFTNSNNFVKK